MSGSTGLLTLPIEILREIVQLVSGNIREPVIGGNAAWIAPKLRPLAAQWTPTMYVQKEDGGNASLEEEIGDAIMRAEGKEIPEKETEEVYYPLKALRMTCRYLNVICCPFLYRDVNLLTVIESIEALDKIAKRIFIPQWQHIRSLSVNADYEYGFLSFDQDRYIAGILSVCKNLTSLSIYYYHEDTDMKRINEETMVLIEKHQLKNLGIYSLPVIWHPYDQDLKVPPGVLSLLDSICNSEVARHRLEALDIVTESLMSPTYDLLRSKLTSLRSLTFRRALRQFLGRIWSPEERVKWARNDHLTSLQFINCQPAYAPHIPDLVRHFPSLKYLMVSTCGDVSDIPIDRLPEDWNRRPDALCRIRPPLETFHIEHMEDWEITSLGVIPTKTLIVTTVKKFHFLTAVTQDPNLFPGLKTLRIAPAPNAEPEPIGESASDKERNIDALLEFCKRRQIELRKDAESTWSCLCCGAEGY